MVEIRNREALERWLVGKSSKFSDLVVMREALRSVAGFGLLEPKIEKSSDWRKNIILPTFMALLDVNKKILQIESDSKFGNILWAFDLVDNQKNSYRNTSTGDLISVFAAMLEAVTINSNAYYASVACEKSNAFTKMAVEPYKRTLWRAISLDATALERGIDLWTQPLWLDDTPEWAVRGWETLASELTKRAPYWRTLVRWYEDRLHGDNWASAQGRPAIPELEIARASLPDSYWKKGGKAVNEAIARLEAYFWDGAEIDDPVLRGLVGATDATEYVENSEISDLLTGDRRQGTADEDERGFPAMGWMPNKLPPFDLPADLTVEQTPTAFLFTDKPDGPIDLAPPAPGEEMLDTPGRSEDYRELRRKLADLQAEGENRLGRLSTPVSAFLELGTDLRRIRNKLFLSRFNTLRGVMTRHEEAVKADGETSLRGDPDPRRLDMIVAERLEDFVGTGNIFIFDEPRLMALDARRLGTTELPTAKREVATISGPLGEAAANQTLITEDAGRIITEQITIIAEAGETAPDRQTAETARDTTRNIVAVVLRKAYLWAKKEALNGGKDLKSGAYRWAGAKLAEYVSDHGLIAAHFVASYAEAVISYVKLAFINIDIEPIIQAISAILGPLI